MSDELLSNFAKTLLADGQRDREVLRRRWHVPSWREDIERIASVLERHPLLVPVIQKAIDDELARLTDALTEFAEKKEPPATEVTPDADRQNETLPDIRKKPAT